MRMTIGEQLARHFASLDDDRILAKNAVDAKESVARPLATPRWEKW